MKLPNTQMSSHRPQGLWGAEPQGAGAGVWPQTSLQHRCSPHPGQKNRTNKKLLWAKIILPLASWVCMWVRESQCSLQEDQCFGMTKQRHWGQSVQAHCRLGCWYFSGVLGIWQHVHHPSPCTTHAFLVSTNLKIKEIVMIKEGMHSTRHAGVWRFSSPSFGISFVVFCICHSNGFKCAGCAAEHNVKGEAK